MVEVVAGAGYVGKGNEMMANINRRMREVQITSSSAQEAGRVGFYFALLHDDLCKEGWIVVAKPFSPALECYDVKDWHGGASEIARFINNPPPPPPPVHDCPKCDCKPECCT